MRPHLLRRTVVVGSARRAPARLAVGAAVVVAAVALASCSATATAPSISPSVGVQTSPVTRGDLSESMSFTGVLTYDHPFDAVFEKTVTTTTTATVGGGGFGGPGGGGGGLAHGTKLRNSRLTCTFPRPV